MKNKSCRSACGREQKAGRQVHIISEAFAWDLRSRGYATITIELYGRIVAHFGRWLSQRQVAGRQIRPHHVEGFLRQHLPRCQCVPPAVRSFPLCRGALHGFLNFLCRERWIPSPPKRAPRLRAVDRLLVEFDEHLDRVHGLAVVTRQARRRYAREWLAGQFGRRRLRLRRVKPRDLLRFVNERAQNLKGTSLHALAVGLRSFLRFLEFTGRIRPGLAGAVPCPASPPFLPPTHILDSGTRLQFLRSFDRRTPAGRRDYAIALCFSELALRANEVAALTLDDVDWRAMTVRLRQTKQRRERLLPLPSRVARALVVYLQRSRPTVGHRLLFISLRPPRGRPLPTDGARQWGRIYIVYILALTWRFELAGLSAMARPLRLLVAGGWYHVTSRGNRRQTLFHTDKDRQRFLGMVEQLPERFGLEVHAFVLMDNHYHLVLRTPQPNLSHAIRWLNVSYSSHFNWAHRQSGHVFQGRYKSILIEELRGVVEVSRYVHLNPVRVGRLALGKAQQKQARQVGVDDPGAELVRQRLKELNGHRWSSWRVYSGAEPAPGWLETNTIARACGGRTRAEQRKALREYTEAPVRQGRLDNPWEGLVGGLVLGGVEFAQRLLKKQKQAVNADEQTPTRRIARANRCSWKEIVGAAEGLLGRKWTEMMTTYGDWGRDGTIHVAIRYGGYRLAEIVALLSGIKYQAGVQAVRRFQATMLKSKEKSEFVERMKRQLGC